MSFFCAILADDIQLLGAMDPILQHTLKFDELSPQHLDVSHHKHGMIVMQDGS